MNKAISYGQVELIPDLPCDCYILEDGTPVMSERGVANLLGVDQKLLNLMRKNWPPKSLKPFIDKGLTMRTNLAEVIVKSNPYQGRIIVIYDTIIIENLIKGYALALANHSLKANQQHIGYRCVTLVCSLLRTALDSAIKEACGITPEVQKTAQSHYADAVALLKESGFTCSLPEMATLQDIATFLKSPKSTVQSFLAKHKDTIPAIPLPSSQILLISKKARKMNGYLLADVPKIVVGMDTEVGLAFKRKLFGAIGNFANLSPKGEIEWREFFSKIFANLGLAFNHPVGKYRVDFFVASLGLCLECNGYDGHKYYDPVEEATREAEILKQYSLIRFHHKVKVEVLFNAILQKEQGKAIRLYEPEHLAL